MNKINNIFLLSFLKKLNTIIFGLISTIFLNRALGSTLKGEYAYIFNIITTLCVILHLGISTIFPNYYRNKYNWTLSTFIYLFSIQFFIYTTISFIIVILFNNLNLFLWIMAIATGIYSNQLLNFCIITNYKLSVIANNLGVILNSILLLFMFFFFSKNLTIAFLILNLKEIIIIIICFSGSKKYFTINDINYSQCFKIIQKGIIPMLTNLLIVLNYRIDVIILQYLRVSYSLIGLYSIGVSLAEYAWVIPDIFKEVIINKTALNDNIKTVSLCIRLSSTALVFMYIVLLISCKFLIILLYGTEYGSAYIVTDIIFAGIYSMIYCKLLGALYLAQGKWRFYFYVLLGSVLINVIGNFVLVPYLGINGAAIISVTSYNFAGIIFLISFKRKYKLKYNELLFVNRTDIANLKFLLLKGKKNEAYSSLKKGG